MEAQRQERGLCRSGARSAGNEEGGGEAGGVRETVGFSEHIGTTPKSRNHWTVDISLCGPWLHTLDSPGSGQLCPSSHSTPPQAVEAAQLAEDLKVQLEHVQTRLREIQPCLAESRAAREEKEELQPPKGSRCVVGRGWRQGRGQQVWIEDPCTQTAPSPAPGGHLRLRRKLKQRKVEVYADADEILQGGDQGIQGRAVELSSAP